MSELLQQAEPLIEEMRGKILQELGERVQPLAGRSWGELAPEIEILTVSIEQADAWRAGDGQGKGCGPGRDQRGQPSSAALAAP